MKPNCDGQAGFTLAEVLVALALFSLIISCFGALFYRLERTESAIRLIEQSENIDVVRRYLLQTLEQIRAYPTVGADGTRTLRFEGERSRILFVSVESGDRETGGLYETEVWLDPEGRLLQQRRPLGWAAAREVPAEVLLENLASLTFSYSSCPLGSITADVHQWAHSLQLPFLISITAEFNAGYPEHWRSVSAFIPAANCPFAI
jgi:prepilin-type N-terminal cleavage/methylation domain-containing protein